LKIWDLDLAKSRELSLKPKTKFSMCFGIINGNDRNRSALFLQVIKQGKKELNIKRKWQDIKQ
jgi:hypothetical protein